MYDKELRKTIGSRMKKRRKELGLTQEYLAAKLDVNKSTIQRYESGSIDNTKKLVVKGLAGALHVTQEWLTGKTDDLETDVVNKVSVEILDAMEAVKNSLPVKADNVGNDFSQTMLLLMLREYVAFNRSLESAYEKYDSNEEYANLAEQIGFDSITEFNEVMFLREIMHTSNAFLELSDLVKDYPKDKKQTLKRLKNLLEFYG